MKIQYLLQVICCVIISHISASAQNVGIGTSSPQRKLHIDAGNFVYSGLMLTNDGTGATTNDGMHLGIQFQSDAPGNQYGYLMVKENVPFIIGTNSAERIRILPNGNVGIGTNNPSEAQLQVHEPAGNTQFIAAAGNNLPGISNFVPGSSPSIGFNARYQSGYKFMGTGYGSFLQYSPSLGRLAYYYSSTSGAADGSMSTVFSLAIDSSGQLGIGTAIPKAPLHVTGNVVFGSSSITPALGYRLSVDGKVICEELKVQLSGSWPDYVFKDEYPLASLDQVENYIRANNHLPGIPNAAQMEKEGLTVGEMQRKMMEKIEELTLYLLQQQKEISALRLKLTTIENNGKANIKN